MHSFQTCGVLSSDRCPAPPDTRFGADSACYSDGDCKPPLAAIAVLSSLFECLRAAHADASVRAIVITGAGKSFSAGADIKSFAAGAPLDPTVNDKFNSLVEAGPKPTVAGQSCLSWQGVHVVSVLSPAWPVAGCDSALLLLMSCRL